MIETFKGLPEDDVAAMLGGNALAFYGFEETGLTEIANRVGPRRADFVG